MPPHTRSRLVAAIAREVADILEFEVKDPAVRRAAPTVIGARLSPNGEEVVVAVAVDERGEDRERVLAALAHDRAFIRARLARRISVRRVPQLTFSLASSIGLADPAGGDDHA